MAEFGSQAYSINNRTVYLKWIKTNFDKIVPTYIGNKNITDTDYCGVNGTFFIPNSTLESSATTRTILWGIAMDSNGEIGEYGRANRYTENIWYPNGKTPVACGTYVRLNKTLSNGYFGICDKIASFDNYYYEGVKVEPNDISWAIGGTSLFMDKTYGSEDEYYNDIEKKQEEVSFIKEIVFSWIEYILNNNQFDISTHESFEVKRKLIDEIDFL